MDEMQIPSRLSRAKVEGRRRPGRPRTKWLEEVRAVPWLRRLVAGLSPRRPGFDLRSVHVGFVVDKVALGRFFPEYFGFLLSVSFLRCSITGRNDKN
jgi:hypothetical protein